jgi:PAS domain-containing protein
MRRSCTHSDLVARVDAQLHRAQARAETAELERRLTAQSDQQRRLYDAILSATPDLVYVFGLDHHFTYANHALLTMWGKTWEEAIGKTCLELGYEPWHAEMHDREIEEVVATMKDLREVDVDILTLGQYLRPSADHIPIDRYVTPEEFADLKREGMAMGFKHVESGPLVRSSYHAWEQVQAASLS